MIDAHVHVWDLDRCSYPWLTDALTPLNRTILLDELPAETDDCGMILVQAADNRADTRVMREQAAKHARVKGIVAWLPLDRPDDVSALITDLAGDPVVVGVRALIHERARHWLAGPAQTASMKMVADAQLPFDFVTRDLRGLEDAIELSDHHPGLSIVIDHLGRPPIGGTAADHRRWSSLISEVAANPLVFAKLSGLTKRGLSGSSATPFVEEALEVFGPSRLMFGSDWPLVRLGGGYSAAVAAVTEAAHGALEVLDAVFSKTAHHFYKLQENQS